MCRWRKDWSRPSNISAKKFNGVVAGATCLDVGGLALEIPKVNAIKVDDTKRVRLPMLTPGDYYMPEVHGENEVLLRRVPVPRRRMTREQVLQAIEESPIRFTRSWDKLKEEIR